MTDDTEQSAEARAPLLESMFQEYLKFGGLLTKPVDLTPDWVVDSYRRAFMAGATAFVAVQRVEFDPETQDGPDLQDIRDRAAAVMQMEAEVDAFHFGLYGPPTEGSA